ncbi:MAG: hypothetical protein A2079_07955 [Geobacteraceae bacterium GWC2_48_7]|nr:MAG: hypothetical protein A2079_07955 [Geobacteraceae bacterium GWC2_48_7]
MRHLINIMVILVIVSAQTAFAFGPGSEMRARSGFGGGNGRLCLENKAKYGWCGKQRGDRYGARRPVETVQEAQRLLVSFFSDTDLTVTDLIEKKWCYHANMVDKNGATVDRVIIDKRSGRIRSIF